MTGVKIVLLLAATSTWGIVAETTLPSPEVLSDASAHGLLALIASMSMGLAFWSMRKTFATMEHFSDSIKGLSDELRTRPCYYKVNETTK